MQITRTCGYTYVYFRLLSSPLKIEYTMPKRDDATNSISAKRRTLRICAQITMNALCDTSVFLIVSASIEELTLYILYAFYRVHLPLKCNIVIYIF